MNGQPKYVTLVSGESPCHIMDELADGFMRWIGKERVRPHLLLGPSADTSEFNYFREVYQWAKEGKWEWIPEQSELLVISTRSYDKVSEWIAQQGFHCAVATVDVRDKPPDETLTLIPGIAAIQVPFKRELTYTSQSTEIFSCPMGLVPETLPPLKPYAERTIPISCLLGVSNITRRSIADAVKTIPEAKVVMERLPREEYLKILLDSKVSVACYGGGFNSYRYWEIPTCGALLVAQPLPLLIPHNFQSGLHALFYTSPQELLAMLRWAMAHSQEAEAIARAGTHHIITHHLTTHRAQYLSGIMRAKIQEYQAKETLRNFPY